MLLCCVRNLNKNTTPISGVRHAARISGVLQPVHCRRSRPGAKPARLSQLPSAKPPSTEEQTKAPQIGPVDAQAYTRRFVHEIGRALERSHRLAHFIQKLFT